MKTKTSPEPVKDAARPNATLNRRWLWSGYCLIAVLLLLRLCYIASGIIELSNDEAYQWLWSKHLALSYYSKPPGIALIQFAGTSLFGDTQFGVRFFSPLFAAVLSLATFGFMAREAGARAAFFLLLIVTSAPLLSVGTILMTVDPPLVLCWMLAMIAGWRAVQPNGTTAEWILAGCGIGLGFLCKYNAAFLVGCWAIFFLLWPPARLHLRKPGPWLGLFALGLCTLPVIIWNARHGWITVRHVASNASLDVKWRPTLRFFGEFCLSELALLNPIFFIGAILALLAFWKRRRENPFALYLFCMGWPVFFGHLLYSLHSRVQPNWIAPAVLPMFCLMVIHWDGRWREGLAPVKGWLTGGLALGLAAVLLLHDTDVLGKLVGHPLPGDMDPLRRVRGYKATAGYVEHARQALAREGKPTFIICDHYGITGLLTFYAPTARAAALDGDPLVYSKTSEKPNNQFYFWPEYDYAARRKSDNAIYVTEPGTVRLSRDCVWRWLAGREQIFSYVPPPVPAPASLVKEFASVTDLGVQEIRVDGRIMKRVQLFECRGLK